MQAIGRLSGGIAHDFNNIFMAIQGHGSLMLLDVEKDHPFYRRLVRIENLVKSAFDLTWELLSFARDQRFNVPVQDIKGILKRLLKNFERRRKYIEIRSDFPHKFVFSEVDRGRLEQVLYHSAECP